MTAPSRAPSLSGRPEAADAIVMAMSVRPAAVPALAPLATLRDRIGNRPATDAEIAAAYGPAPRTARIALNALASVDANHIDIPALAGLATIPAAGGRCGRRLRCSVSVDALPDDLFERLSALRSAPYGRYFEKGSTVTINMIEAALCQLCHAAGAAGVAAGFSSAAIHAYIAALLARGARPITIYSRLGILRLFAKAFGLPFPFADERAFWWARSRREIKRSDRVIETLSIDRDRYLAEAEAVLARAPDLKSGMHRVMAFNKAGLFALASEGPIRRADKTRLVTGVSIRREAKCWTLDFLQSKTGKRHRSTLDERITPFLDAVILRGAPVEAFDELYRRAQGRPFFARLDHSAITASSVTSAFRRHFRTGPHIARNVAYDARAEEQDGLAEGARRCGHAGPDMARAYMPRRAWQRRRTAAQNRQLAMLRRRGFTRRRIIVRS